MCGSSSLRWSNTGFNLAALAGAVGVGALGKSVQAAGWAHIHRGIDNCAAMNAVLGLRPANIRIAKVGEECIAERETDMVSNGKSWC
jgi:hypothetical protein